MYIWRQINTAVGPVGTFVAHYSILLHLHLIPIAVCLRNVSRRWGPRVVLQSERKEPHSWLKATETHGHPAKRLVIVSSCPSGRLNHDYISIVSKVHCTPMWSCESVFSWRINVLDILQFTMWVKFYILIIRRLSTIWSSHVRRNLLWLKKFPILFKYSLDMYTSRIQHWVWVLGMRLMAMESIVDSWHRWCRQHARRRICWWQEVIAQCDPRVLPFTDQSSL